LGVRESGKEEGTRHNWEREVGKDNNKIQNRNPPTYICSPLPYVLLTRSKNEKKKGKNKKNKRKYIVVLGVQYYIVAD